MLRKKDKEKEEEREGQEDKKKRMKSVHQTERSHVAKPHCS